MNSKISFINPTLPSSSDMIEDYEKIHANNYYSNDGEYYFKFKNDIEKFIGNEVHVSIVANATLGIMLSLKSCALKDKKYVLVPSFTFAAGPQSILWAGYEPYFIDVDPHSYQPCLSLSDSILREGNVAAILLCNTFGIGNEDIASWEQLSEEVGVPLIIDSAAGFGSYYNENELLGQRGECEIFSLHATKPFAIGEGGIVASRNESLISQIQMMKNFGFDRHRYLDSIGLNAKIPEWSCAIGVRMLPGLMGRIEQRRLVFDQYCKSMVARGCKIAPNARNSSLCFGSFLIPDSLQKESLMESFINSRIEVRDYYNPMLHQVPLFKEYPRTEMKVTEHISQKFISLPNSEKLTTSEVERILTAIESTMEVL